MFNLISATFKKNLQQLDVLLNYFFSSFKRTFLHFDSFRFPEDYFVDYIDFLSLYNNFDVLNFCLNNTISKGCFENIINS